MKIIKLLPNGDPVPPVPQAAPTNPDQTGDGRPSGKMTGLPASFIYVQQGDPNDTRINRGLRQRLGRCPPESQP